MFCENCGTELNDNATFCNGCGHETTKMKTRRSIRKYRLICAVFALALLCVGALAVSLILSNSILKKDALSQRDSLINEDDKNEKKELCGLYTVGEDEELQPGVYNITPIDSGERINIKVYLDKDWYDQSKEGDSTSKGLDWLIVSQVAGYKLREGNIVRVFVPGAEFERID